MSNNATVAKAALLLFVGLCNLPTASAMSVSFINGTGDGTPQAIEQGDSPSICRAGNRLASLDKTRQVLGEPSCQNEASETPEFASDIDVLILVDDTRGVDDNIRERIDAIEGRVLTCSTAGSRKRVYPSFIELDNGGDQLRALLVGAAMLDLYFSETSATEPLSEYLEQIIMRSQGLDAPADSGQYSPSISPFAANGVPAGKGLFQTRALNTLVDNQYKPYKMGHMADHFHDSGLNWFAVSSNVGGKCEGRLYTEYLNFGHPNFQIFIWRLNETVARQTALRESRLRQRAAHIEAGNNELAERVVINTVQTLEQQVDEMIQAAKNTKAKGIIIDIEGSFTGHRDDAIALYELARQKTQEFAQQAHGWPLSVGITMIGFQRLSAYLDDGILRAADFIMPQIYNKQDRFTDEFIQRRINFWDSGFADQTVIPIIGAHHCDTTETEAQCPNERSKNAQEFAFMTRHFSTPLRPSVGWWRYGSIEAGNASEQGEHGHWQQLADFPIASETQQ